MKFQPEWCVTGLLSVSIAFAQAQTADSQVSSAQRQTNWQEDLQFLVSGLSAPGDTEDEYGPRTRGQKDFAKLYPPAWFNAEIETLKQEVPHLSDDEIVLRLMRLIASAHVAHNTVQFPSDMGFSGRLPLSFAWFADGLAVTAASSEYSSALGARVKMIGNMTPDQLLTAVAPYIGHENDTWLRQQATEYIKEEAVLRHFGLMDRNEKVAITLEKPGQSPLTISVSAADPQTKQINFYEGLHVPTPLYRSHPGEHDRFYWFQRLADSQTFYIQYDACMDNPQFHFDDFTHQVITELDANPVKRVIIDLRFNGGGDSSVLAPLTKALQSRNKSTGPVYVLIGPYTFSSAMMNAMELRRDLKATLIGEPTGGSPSCYGEVRTLTLPNSKLNVRYTTKFFGQHDDTQSNLQPDILAARTIADALSGRDTVLEVAIRQP
jgi:hypothetical protein